MHDPVERSAEWVYKGVWLVLADCFRVPRQPPSLPVEQGAWYRAFHPSRRYLAYLKMYFWIGLVAIDLSLLAGWLALVVWRPAIGWIAALPVFLIAVVPDIIAYVAIHLRYDTMWYVLTDRSLRTRRGIWVILEHTITFENVQDVHVRQGPVQQLLRISSLLVETAGSAEVAHENRFAVGNKAIMEGIENPDEIRNLIMERVRASRFAGLGDEQDAATHGAWLPAHVQLLREIRDAARGIA